MKSFIVTMARGQDPQKIHNAALYLKMQADLHEKEEKQLNLFLKFVATGNVEDLEALKTELYAYHPAWKKMKQERDRLREQFDGRMKVLLDDILFNATETAWLACTNMIGQIRRKEQNEKNKN